MANECVVYHKHLAGMDTSDGYIGISKNFEERMKQHAVDAFSRNSIYTVHEKMRIHRDDVITSKIFEGTRKECERIENELRPKWHIGWNMCIGGGSPARERWYSKKWLDVRLYNPKTWKEVVIGPGYWLDDMAKEHLPEEILKSATDRLAFVLYGKIHQVKGWELANSQLAAKVKDLTRTDWEVAYLTNGVEKVKVNKKGNTAFHKYTEKPSKRGIIKNLIIGTSKTNCGWQLTTEEEWLETAERVEFK